MKFGVGDRVRYCGETTSKYHKGMTAIVIVNERHAFAVQWDDPNFNGHDCGGRARDNRGWWVTSIINDFRLADETPFQKSVREYIKTALDQ